MIPSAFDLHRECRHRTSATLCKHSRLRSILRHRIQVADPAGDGKTLPHGNSEKDVAHDEARHHLSTWSCNESSVAIVARGCCDGQEYMVYTPRTAIKTRQFSGFCRGLSGVPLQISPNEFCITALNPPFLQLLNEVSFLNRAQSLN